MEARLTGEDLAARYTDVEWRSRYLELVNVATLLRNSVIAANYRVPDEFNMALCLSDAGTRLQAALTTKHDVPAKDARLMCLLEIATDELLVDLEKTNFDALVSSISKQITSGALRYPNIYGGILYRRAASLFPDRRDRLNVEETRELLDGTPPGIFQTGGIVVGPLGALRAAHARWLPPTLRVPLQHCSDVTCHLVHATYLSTDYDAQINQNLPKITKAIERHDQARGAWTELAGIIAEIEDLPYDDFNMTGVPVCLGDCFTETELVAIAQRLEIDLSSLGQRDPDRSALMQLIWLRSDLEVSQAIDSLVHGGDISVPADEIRRPRLASVEVGTYELRTEIGRHGVRVKPTAAGLPHLRLARLVSHLYDVTSAAGQAELSWQLRGVEGVALEDKIEQFLRVTPPPEVVARLVLSRREHVLAALDELRIDPRDVNLDDLGPSFSDAAVAERLLWKLGFDLDMSESMAADFERKRESVSRALRDAQASSVVDIEMIRGEGRRLFISLEGLLADSLSFAWWSMLTDHLNAPRPFTFMPSLAEGAWGSIADHSSKSPAIRTLPKPGPPTLGPLCRAFGVLADMLRHRQASAATFQRSREGLPAWFQKSELREFPFKHTVPYLDLLPRAQESIADGLVQVSETLERSAVHRVRNNVSHFQRSLSSIEEVERAVQGAAQAVARLDRMGFVRIPYRVSRTSTDEWARSIVVMRSQQGDEITFSRPSRVGYVGMPFRTTPQYLVREAVFCSPNEVLRFAAGADSEFADMWSDYPLPRRATRSRFTTEPASASSVVNDTHSVLPGV